jgi:hypothetical protein
MFTLLMRGVTALRADLSLCIAGAATASYVDHGPFWRGRAGKRANCQYLSGHATLAKTSLEHKRTFRAV